jgi:hypothetical protein
LNNVYVHFTQIASKHSGGRNGCNRTVVSLIPICGKLHLLHIYVIKFDNDLRQVCGFLKIKCMQVSSINKSDSTDIL